MPEIKKTSITNIAQRRADFAYQCAEEGNKEPKKSEYKSYVKKIPMLIKSNGLSATFAFMFSKSKTDRNKAGYAYKLILDQTQIWLNHYSVLEDKLGADKKLYEEVVKLNSTDYRSLTNEVLALFNWLRRFAEGLIGE